MRCRELPVAERLKPWELLVRTARLMVGIPDYETYVEHRRTKHPGEPVMTFEEVLPQPSGRALCRWQRQNQQVLLT